MKVKFNLMNAVVISIIVITIASCSKWDDFKKYTEKGEIIYTGKLDSVKIYSGKNRVRLYGVFSADPKIVKCKILWNSASDSIVFNFDSSVSNQVFDRTFTVDEGVKNFQIFTYDKAGNSSVVVNAIGTSYGDNYRRKLNNRPVASVTYSTATGTTINWDVMDLSTGALYTETRYPLNADSLSVSTLVSQSTTVLNKYNYQTSGFKYRTVFRPDSSSIDTFATAYIVR